MKSFLIVSIVTAVIVSFLFQGDVPITGTKVKLGTPGYDIQDVSTPVATGTLLEYLAYLFTQSRFGPSIRRYLLNDNHVEIARDLAAQIHLSPLYYPMRRVGKDELYAISEEESIAQLTAALQTGVSGSRGKLSDTPRTIEEYAAFYKEGHLPSQVIQRTLQTMRAWEKEGFNIFSNVNDEDVMRQAYASDARHKAGQALSVLDGVPIAFKDMMSIENLTYYNGNSNKAKHSMNWKTSSVDDIMVRRFRAQGAIIYGYTIMVEGGVTPLGWNSHFQGPTSPYSLNRYSGGSSSGSAVAVATGLVPVAVGFDGGGSIRVPCKPYHLY